MASAKNTATVSELNEEAKDALLQELKDSIVRLEQDLSPTRQGERRKRPGGRCAS